MKEKRVIIWSTVIGDILEEDKYVGGITVQLYFWAQTFARHGWKVITFTSGKSFKAEGISFQHLGNWGKFELLHDWFGVFWRMLRFRPRILIARGANRSELAYEMISRLFGVKHVFFGASDVNFVPGKEQIAGGSKNHWLWRKAVPKLRYIVVQNRYQHDTLLKNYGRDSLILYNIWGDSAKSAVSFNDTDVVWVANFRPLKRPEWMIAAAIKYPNLDFTIVGGPMHEDRVYYDKICKYSEGIPNLHFLGMKNFSDTNEIVSKSRLLCCTSTFEGFPNTFLQAWSQDVPVLSTVNPNGVITGFHLGEVVETEEEFCNTLGEMLMDEKRMAQYKHAVNEYFAKHHSTDINFEKFIQWLGEK